MNKNLIIAAAGGIVTGAVAGGAAVYVFLNKKYEVVLNDAIDRISDEVRRDYARFYADYQPKPAIPDADVEDTESAAEKLVKVARAHAAEMREELDYNGTEEDPEDPVLITEKNLFAEVEKVETEQDRLAELFEPKNGRPYLITEDQYLAPFENFGKMTLTYFEEDDILIEEEGETIINNAEEIIGSEILNSFENDTGASDDRYVRNETLEADFEVNRDRRSYSEVIAGFKAPETERTRKKPRREGDE